MTKDKPSEAKQKPAKPSEVKPLASAPIIKAQYIERMDSAKIASGRDEKTVIIKETTVIIEKVDKKR